MATIKTQVVNGVTRILTKTTEDVQRVSCSCCQEEATCCVYPAACQLGPASIIFYGQVLAGSSGTYGDTTNGVILEGEAWAIYRNSVRTTTDCIGMATSGSISIAAILPSSLFLSFDSEVNGIQTSTLNFTGAIDPLSINDPNLFGETGGQCFWNGPSGGQAYDEGFTLIFNPANCRWELASSPLNYLYAYRADASPVGTYAASDPDLSNVVIA